MFRFKGGQPGDEVRVWCIRILDFHFDAKSIYDGDSLSHLESWVLSLRRVYSILVCLYQHTLTSMSTIIIDYVPPTPFTDLKRTCNHHLRVARFDADYLPPSLLITTPEALD